MANTARDIFIVGLRNAHAMETQARELMERQSERLTDYPDVQARLRLHLSETNQHLERLEQLLQSCGETASTLKDAAQSVMANAMAMTHAMAGDEILKDMLANNAFENFEIAAYKSLIALSDEAGMSSARPQLEATLQDEQRMADWVAANIEKVTRAYVGNAQRAAA